MISELRARPRISAAGTLLVAALAVGLVAGCGGSGSSPSAAVPTTVMVSESAGEGSSPASTPGSASAESSVPADAIVVHVKDFTLEPLTVEHVGTTVTLDVVNDGPTVHNVTVRDSAGEVLFATQDLRTGESEVVTGSVPAAGGYVLFCSLPGHESLGIKGTLEIR